jgi:hypothetical protein
MTFAALGNPSTSAVRASAGKNVSSANSSSVTSTGVPNTVVVLRNESTPCSLRNRNGITTPAWSRGNPENPCFG